MDLILRRFRSDKDGTFGTLETDNTVFFSVEKPWENNESFNSCIPKGEYALIPAKSSKYRNCLAVVNESEGITRFEESYSKRYAILIHWGNWPRNFMGCIGLGDNYIHEENMVTNSRKSIIDFYKAVDPTKEHHLTIMGV